MRGVFGNFANYVEFICAQSALLRRRNAYAHAGLVYTSEGVLIETSKPCFLEEVRLLKSPQKVVTAVTRHTRLLLGNHNTPVV